MTAQELREQLFREPFQPFRVHLRDGRVYDIRYPSLNLVGESIINVGIPTPDDPDPKFSDHQEWVPLKLIGGIDPLPKPTTPAIP